jgi:hypothetical protein
MFIYQFLMSVFFITLFLFNSGCGRKYRNIFLFNSEESIKLETLDFPSVRSVRVVTADQRVCISWDRLVLVDKSVSLVGYNIYRLTQAGFIPRTACNNAPLRETIYYDDLYHKHSSYVIRGVFMIQGRFKEGPASLIACS